MHSFTINEGIKNICKNNEKFSTKANAEYYEYLVRVVE